MKNYKSYPKYKNSGIPWLGEIPEHWEVKSVGESFKLSVSVQMMPLTLMFL